MRISFLSYIYFSFISIGFPQSDQYIEFAKSYASIRYFYPEPDLKEMDWNKYLITNSDKILMGSFNLENEILSIAPKASFRHDSIVSYDTIQIKDLKNYYYWQHLGGLVTQKYGYPENLMSSQLVGDFNRSFTMLLDLLKATNSTNRKIRLSFYAKFPTQNKDSACIMIHSGYKKNGEMIDQFYKKFIYPSTEWKHYVLDTVFCENCTKYAISGLKIVRQNSDSLFVDKIEITDLEDSSLLYSCNFENYDYANKRFPNYEYFYLSDNMAEVSKDCIDGQSSLKLFGNNELTLYDQTNLKKTIQVKLNGNYWMQFPRFINKNDSTDLKSIVSKFNNLEIDSGNSKSTYIADIIHLWTVLENSYPYTEVRKTIHAKALFNKCINNVLADSLYQLDSHFSNLTYLLSAYNDPHFELKIKGKKPYRCPFKVQFIDGEYIISDVFSKDYSKYLGAKVKSINGILIDKKLDDIIYNKQILNSNLLLNTYLESILTTYEKKQFLFLTDNNQEIIVTDLNLITGKPKYLEHFQNSILNTSFALLDGRAIYIHLKDSARAKPSKIYNYVNDSLSKFEYIILDYRGLEEKNYIYNAVLDLKLLKNKIKIMPDNLSKIEEPFNTEFKSLNVDLYSAIRTKLDSINFNSKIIALVDENVRSSPERQILPLYDSGLITLIGKQTAGTAGFINKITLPSKAIVHYTTGKTVYKNGVEYQNNGMKPHYEISETYTKNSENDAFLEKAIEIIKNE